MTRREIREYIFKVVFQIPFYGADNMQEQTAIDIESLKELRENPLDDSDKVKFSENNEKYITDKLSGLLFHLKDIDECLRKNSNNWDLDRMGKEELAVLRLAAFEILYDEDVPDVVAINEGIEIAKKYSDEKSAKFVNGVLSGILKSKENNE